MRSQSSTLFLPIVITIDLLSLFHVKTKVTEACFCVYGSGKKFLGRMERKQVIYFQEASLLGRGQKEWTVSETEVNYKDILKNNK